MSISSVSFLLLQSNIRLLTWTSVGFQGLSEEDQCKLCALIGQLACVKVWPVGETSGEEDKDLPFVKCYTCDIELRETPGARTVQAVGDDQEMESVFKTIESLIRLLRIPKNRRPRIAVMLAMRRYLSHTANTDHLNLSTSSFGQWCLQALHSSIRELRIAAGSATYRPLPPLVLISHRRNLPIFLQKHLPNELLVQNRLIGIDILRDLSSQSDLSLQETNILAWGQIARYVNRLCLIKIH